jgi:hypothetical protein
MRMAHRCRGLGFAQESTAGVGIGGQIGRQDLHRDDPIQLRVERAEHDPHTTPANDVDDLIRSQGAEATRLVAGVQEVEWHLVRQWLVHAVGHTLATSCWRFKEAAGIVIRAQQSFDAPPLFCVGAGFVQEHPALVDVGHRQGGQKQAFHRLRID